MKRLDTDWLLDIIEAIDNVNAALAGKTRRNLDQDVVLRAAISHFVMIISEASRHVPEAYKRDYPIIAWGEIAAIGNRIRHGYYEIKNEVLWSIFELELPALRHTTEQLLSKAGIEPP